MEKYLIALPIFAGSKGFCHQTILVSARTKQDAIAQARHHHPNRNIGDIKNTKIPLKHALVTNSENTLCSSGDGHRRLAFEFDDITCSVCKERAILRHESKVSYEKKWV